jgi:hypothetical protein
LLANIPTVTNVAFLLSRLSERHKTMSFHPALEAVTAKKTRFAHIESKRMSPTAQGVAVAGTDFL